LPDSEAQQFEEHYFDCPVCLAQVEALQAVRARLAQIPADQHPPKKHAKLIAWPTVTAALIALAASLIIVFLSFRFLLPNSLPPTVAIQTGPQPPANAHPSATPTSPSVSQLADLTLPPFRAANLRGESGDGDFNFAMKAYSGGDCRGALKGFSRVSATGSNALASRFYSGICLMHIGNLPGAAATLQRVTAAGDSPQQEAAFYYLAQIALVRNDAPSARQNLDRTVALHGDFEQRARRQSAALTAAPGKH
jgi:hypothetical protein